MSQIMKSFLGIFIMLFMALTSIGILSAFLQVMDAQDMHARIINELENSNFSASVIRENFEMAEEAGYQLSVTLYYENEKQTEYPEKEAVQESSSAASMAKVNLEYPFQIAFFEMNSCHVLSGFAR